MTQFQEYATDYLEAGMDWPRAVEVACTKLDLHARDANGGEHGLVLEGRVVKPSILGSYAEEDEYEAKEMDVTPRREVKVSCWCGKLDTWLAEDTEPAELFGRHVQLAVMKL